MSRDLRIAAIMAYHEPVGSFVGQAIESIRAQTAYDLLSELILVNDGGSEAVQSTTDDAAAPDFVDVVTKLVRHPQNRGQAAALNMALRMLEPETNAVAFLDADDLWTPDKLGAQAQALEMTGASAVYGRQALVGPIYRRGEHYEDEGTLPAARVIGTTLVRRSACPYFAEHIGVGHTLLWFEEMAERGPVRPLDRTVLLRRVHGGNYGIVHAERAVHEYGLGVNAVLQRRIDRQGVHDE